MLEAYLRLANMSDARGWILREQPLRLHDHMIALSAALVCL